MRIECRAQETWRLLLLAWSLGLLLGGCATAPQVKVAAEVFDPEKAKNRSVAVIADLYMDDPVEADTLAGLIRNQLTANGFKVQETENEAELVVIPTIERSKPAGYRRGVSTESMAFVRPLLRFGQDEHDGIAERLAKSGIRIRVCGTCARAAEGGSDGYSGQSGSLA